ncbi:MAG TPA: hypothetical protein VF666_09220 [Pyrinomonadaceae bacterium]|jgi:hypothetical protein
MNTIVITYLTYLGISIALTIWVAQTLHKNGRVFLVDVFRGNEALADSVNHLLVVGFYLINFGYVTLALRIGYDVETARAGIEALSWKVGLVLLVLGAMHFFNLFVFSRIRSNSNDEPAPPLTTQDYVSFRMREPHTADGTQE